jgi:uncharacterized protein (DUF2141 family)
MNNLRILMFLATLFLSGFVCAQTGTIKIEIQGIESSKGIMQIGLYNSVDDFPDFEKSFKGASPKPNTSGVVYSFENIPAGSYAIALWQDENEDKELNKNMFGVPKESYGFSNNVFGTFGPPDFEEASFIVEEGKTSMLKITLK